MQRAPTTEKKPPSHFYYGAIDATTVTNSGLRVVKPPEKATATASGSVVAPAAASSDTAAGSVPAAVRSHQQLVAAYEVQKAARSVAAPTLDNDVKTRLRELGEPICLFGEGPYERRERLRYLLARQSAKQTSTTQEVVVHLESSRVDQQQRPRLFFSRGGPALLAARKEIARFSLPRAVKRLRRDKQEYGTTDPLEVENRVAAYNRMLARKLEVLVSQVGSERPMASGKFAPGDAFLATSSWSPVVRLWRVTSCDEFGQGLHGHKERVNSVSWNPLFSSTAQKIPPSETGVIPEVTMTDDDDDCHNGVSSRNVPEEFSFSDGWHLATGSFDGTVGVWKLTSQAPVALLKGHEERVNRVESHPSGKYLASTSHDETWRLWDVAAERELLTQEGHSTGVYGLRFHPDGSLVFTGDLGGIVRGWDLRTGRTVFPLLGHVKQVLGITINPWRPNQLATASDDNTVRIWDIRKQRCIDMILAHDKLISEVAYEPVHGRFLMTTSYDNSLKVWSSTEFSCSRTLIGHEARIMGGDISGDGQCLVSVSFDRTFKLWTLTRQSEIDDVVKT